MPVGIDAYPEFLNGGPDGGRMKLIPEYLKEAGYSTHLVGKWHIGQARDEHYPLNRGFDTFYGFTASQTDFWPKCGMANGKSLMRNQNDWFEYAEDTYCTPDFTDKAISILTNETDSGPKFVFLAYNAPHLPIQAPSKDVEEMRARYKKKGQNNLSDQLLTYHAMIKGSDQNLL